MKQLSILFRGTLGFPFPVSGAFALCLLLLASCGGDDSSDEGYAAIESASFTFDETTPANNAVRVIANTGWQVFWTPESAAVRVEPASGSGNGVFYVRDMPKGASVQVGVRAASGKTSGKPVTVTRAADAVGVTLSVAPAELLYDPASPASNVVTVTTNASWKAACPNSALKFSPASGTGSATITIADAPAGQRTTLTVTAGEGSGAKTATCVIVRNPETPAETVFSLDFGNGAGGVWAGANQEWKTQTGTGASTVTYAVNNVRINNDNYGSAGKYSGASGKAYAKMFYNASTDYFVIQDISLPAGQTNFTLAFGAIFPADDVSLTVSADGAVWKPLVYTGRVGLQHVDRDDGGLHARAACSETVDSPCADGYGARLRTEFRRHPAHDGRRRSAGRPRDGCGPSLGRASLQFRNAFLRPVRAYDLDHDRFGRQAGAQLHLLLR